MRIKTLVHAIATTGLTLLIVPATARAQCYPETYGANPNDNLPDDAAIQQCLWQGGTTLLDSTGFPGYIVANTLQITADGTTLRGTDPSGFANVIANPGLPGQILVANNVNNFTLSNLFFNGNKGNRDASPCGSTFDYGKNLRLTGSGFRVLGVESANAICGSGAEVGGSGFEVANSYFVLNGYPAAQGGGGGPWADGMTVWACLGGGSIHDSQFLENTDVDLVVGGGNTCSITNNLIVNSMVHAFAGLQLGIFAGATVTTLDSSTPAIKCRQERTCSRLAS
jgi:hypothetical protein